MWDKELGVFYDGLDGSIEELLQLGKEYLEGQGSQKDIRKGMECYKKAAEKGNVDAQFWLGYVYAQGEGIAQDYEEAMKWYQKAAAQGDDDAQNSIGLLYTQGKGVGQDYEEALKSCSGKPQPKETPLRSIISGICIITGTA